MLDEEETAPPPPPDTLRAEVARVARGRHRTFVVPGRRGARAREPTQRKATIDRQHANRSGCPTPSMIGETSAWAHAGVHRVPRW